MTKTMTLDELVAQLRGAYGDDLVAAALYGSAASGEAVQGRSDLNVLVVVRTLTPASVRAAGPVAIAWAEAGNPPPLTLTEREWRRSADVFAMEYADILDRHRVLAGTLPLDGMAVDPGHLRLQLEQEALGKLLRLRHARLLAAGNPARQVAVLEHSFSAVRVLFRAALRLVGESPPTGHEALVRAAAARAGFDPSPFVAVAAHVKGSAPLAPVQAAETLGAYHDAIEKLVWWLDALPH